MGTASMSFSASGLLIFANFKDIESVPMSRWLFANGYYHLIPHFFVNPIFFCPITGKNHHL